MREDYVDENMLTSFFNTVLDYVYTDNVAESYHQELKNIIDLSAALRPRHLPFFFYEETLHENPLSQLPVSC